MNVALLYQFHSHLTHLVLQHFPSSLAICQVLNSQINWEFFRDIKLHIALGRLERFLHSLRSNFVRLVKCSNNNDRSFITISHKQSSDNRDIFPIISRNFFSLEQPPRSIISIASKLILWGRLLTHLQPFKSNWISCLRSPRDAQIIYSLVQRRRNQLFKIWDSTKVRDLNQILRVT